MTELITDLGSGTLTATQDVIIVAPAGINYRLDLITLVSTDTVDRTVNIYLNRAGTAIRIAPKDLTVRPGYIIELDRSITMPSGSKIEAIASSAGVIEWTANGVQVFK